MPEKTDRMADATQAQDLPQQFDYDFSIAVEHIESWIDGGIRLLPNITQIYSSILLVKTAHAKRRSQYDVGIGYGDDINEACKVIGTALSGVAGVENDPPEVFLWDLAASWVTIRAR